jgi:hypothetical protein
MKKNLAVFGTSLSREEAKNILGGVVLESSGCKEGRCGVYDGDSDITYWGSCVTWFHDREHGGGHCMCWTDEIGHYESTNGYSACTA